ncbi:restriction endonuclease subunit S [Enterococcus faecium]|uniref:restriction endonuclease subunit S n=1 Tax=Enterococcus faecium TaxID=1352 RepID=UPI001C611C2F|nr:restriction endonuclease subunit S [Enterococcus faecium]
MKRGCKARWRCSNMSNDTLPEIRFPEFTDEWEQRKLSDEMTDFIVPMRDKPKEFGGNIPWTRIEDIEGKFLNDSLSEQYVTEETIQKMNLKIIPKDSLIVSSSATFGVVAVVTQNLITNQTFIGLVPREKNTLDYWYSFFQSSEARKYMKLQSAGSTIFYIARDSFEKMPISVPKIDEMIKIGEYFSNLDNLITLHHRKLDLLKETKKGFLQKMFPKNGAKVPEIRFPGFTEDWEERKLGELTESFDGKRVPIDSDLRISGKYPYYGATGIIDYVDDYIFNGEYVLLAEDGANIIMRNYPVAYLTQGKFWLNNHAHIMRMRNGSNYFLVQVLEKIDYKKYNTGTAQPKLNSKIVKNIELKIPHIEEQQQIGNFFKQLDDIIALHQRKLDLLKETKKGFLQKMFV